VSYALTNKQQTIRQTIRRCWTSYSRRPSKSN